jgi:hypothetical protein
LSIVKKLAVERITVMQEINPAIRQASLRERKKAFWSLSKE